MTLTVQHIQLSNEDDCDGVLIYAEDVLLAVLSQLSFQHGARAGRWYLECGFGAALAGYADFADIDAACDWIEDRQRMHGNERLDLRARRAS